MGMRCVYCEVGTELFAQCSIQSVFLSTKQLDTHYMFYPMQNNMPCTVYRGCTMPNGSLWSKHHLLDMVYPPWSLEGKNILCLTPHPDS